MGDFFRRRDRSKRAGRRTTPQRPALRSERLEPRYAMTATPIGNPIEVNDFTAGDQSIDSASAAVAVTASSRIVVWEGRGADDRDGVFARVFGTDGVARGDSFRVNTTERGVQHSPSVAAAADGSFVVVWAGRGVGDKSGVFLQRYNAQGAELGTEVRVASTAGGDQTSPAIAMDADGSFVVAWEGVNATDASGVFYRRFSSAGALGTEARANTTTTNDQQGASVAYLAPGEFVVGWQSRSQDGSGWGVYSQRYNGVGLPVGAETALNATTASSQTEVALARDPAGGYVASWQSLAQDGDGWGVVGRRFSGSGAPTTAERLLNDTTSGDQVAPALAVASDGQWVASWRSRAAGATAWEVISRTFDSSSTPQGPSRSAGPATASPAAPAVAVQGESALLVVAGAAPSGVGELFAQRLTVTLANAIPPTAPVLATIGDRVAEVAAPLEVIVTATDANAGDTLTFTLDASASPTGATITRTGANTAVVRWTPAVGDDGRSVGFRVVVTDNSTGALSDSESFTVRVAEIPVSVDPNGAAAGTGAASQFLVGDAAVPSVAPNLTIAGADVGRVVGATVRFVTPPTAAVERVSVSLPTGSPITSAYDAALGQLTLTGSATAAEYQTALRTLIYVNTAESPTGTRDLAVTVTDADGQSAPASVVVSIVQPDLVAFAGALRTAGATFYGAAWCEACTQQRELLQDGEQFLPFVEVTNPDRSFNTVAQQNTITVLPTWVFADGRRVERVLTLAELSTLAGVPVPTSNRPFVAPIADTTLLVGSPLHVALDGYDPNGGPLTYTVSSDNAAVTATLLTGNRSIRFGTRNTVEASGGDFGDLVFQLFEDRASRATDRVIELAEDGFYDGLSFHRVVNDFVIQGGDPNGNGTGGSSLSDFDDQFHPDLQHNRTGLLSYAKSDDDTNDSQFFVTEGNNASSLRNLDFNHTVFGLLVEGEAHRAAISDTAVNSSAPVNPVRFDEVEVFTDTENAVLVLRAANGATGSANITVTVTDSNGNTFQRTFRVTLAADTFNSRPYLQDIPPVSGPRDQPLTFQLRSIDVEGDSVRYFASPAPGQTTTFTVFADPATGLVTVTPPAGFTGTLNVEVSVHRGNFGTDGDFQRVAVQFT